MGAYTDSERIRINSYEDVRTMLVNHLQSVSSRANGDSAKDLWGKIDEKIDCYANGDLDHAVDTITLLWRISKSDGQSPPTPSPQEANVSSLTSLSYRN